MTFLRVTWLLLALLRTAEGVNEAACEDVGGDAGACKQEHTVKETDVAGLLQARVETETSIVGSSMSEEGLVEEEVDDEKEGGKGEGGVLQERIETSTVGSSMSEESQAMDGLLEDEADDEEDDEGEEEGEGEGEGEEDDEEDDEEESQEEEGGDSQGRRRRGRGRRQGRRRRGRGRGNGGSGGRGNGGSGGRGGGSPAPPPAPPPSGVTSTSDPDAQEWLLNHNYYRCIHNTGEIKWDNDVAAGAAAWAAKGQMSHAKCYKIPAPKGPSGENLAAGQRSIAAAVHAWYDESPEKGPGCGGHCTALLWKKSHALGCSKKNTWNGNRPLYVCRYARSAANFGSKSDGVNAQDMSKEPDCYKKFPVQARWGQSGGGAGNGGNGGSGGQGNGGSGGRGSGGRGNGGSGGGGSGGRGNGGSGGGGSGGRGNGGSGGRGGGSPAPPPAPPPSGVTSTSDPDAQEWLLNHNYYRCIHNTGEIEWDNDVAAGAAAWAAKGQMSHAKCYKIPAPKGPSGENLAAGQRSIAAAVHAWYDESPEKGPSCGGHCTALLWKKSHALGCSKKNTWNGNRPLYVCRYARSAANFGSKSDGVNAQDMSKEPDCYKKFPVQARWGGAPANPVPAPAPRPRPTPPAPRPTPPAPRPNPPAPRPNPPAPAPSGDEAGLLRRVSDMESLMAAMAVELDQILNALKR